MIMAGVNQCLMLGLGMVVIAGIIGAGGLGEVVYSAIRYLQIDRAVDAGLAIVILAINLDRITQGAVERLRTGSIQ
jgi:glycine betaine/proline transport system permease protein